MHDNEKFYSMALSADFSDICMAMVTSPQEFTTLQKHRKQQAQAHLCFFLYFSYSTLKKSAISGMVKITCID